MFAKSRDGITWQQFGAAVWFILRYSALCMVFSLAISGFEMKFVSQEPGYVNEFIGMYLVVGFIFGLFSCAAAFPAYVAIYLKAPPNRLNWYAVLVSLVASICVWLLFYALRGEV